MLFGVILQPLSDVKLLDYLFQNLEVIINIVATK